MFAFFQFKPLFGSAGAHSVMHVVYAVTPVENLGSRISANVSKEKIDQYLLRDVSFTSFKTDLFTIIQTIKLYI